MSQGGDGGLLGVAGSWEQHDRITPHLTVIAGCAPASPDLQAGVVPRGVRIGVMLNGTYFCECGHRASGQLVGPHAFLLSSDRDWETRYRITGREGIRYVSLHIDLPDAAGSEEEPILALFDSLKDCRFDFRATPSDPCLCSLANQIHTCPYHGLLRTLYLTGKAFEIVVQSVKHFSLPTIDALPALPAANIRRLRDAREILLARIDDPPPLADLARMVGTNSRTLRDGFKELFGLTPFAFVHERRLLAAYDMLASGQCSVVHAAAYVGYGPAHFSIAFKKRFGLSPSQLRR